MAGQANCEILIFIPSFNDRERIAELCEQCLSLGEQYSVLVVDDGSTPPLEVPARRRQHVFRSPYNAGLGCATNIAMDFAFRNGCAVLVRIDADGQHDPADIPSVIAPLLEGRADVTVGNRLNSISGTSIRATLAGAVKRHIRFIANLVTGLRVADWHTGFMAFSARAVCALCSFSYERFPEVEILARSTGAGLRVEEVPVMQKARTHGISSLTLLSVIRHMLGVYSILLRHAIREKNHG